MHPPILPRALLALSILGCQPQPPAQSRALPVTESTEATADQLLGGRWKPGVHYDTLKSAQAGNVSHDKVEVMEFFSYGCSHCFKLEPHLVLWSRTKPDYVEFVRMPAPFSPAAEAHARLFYILESLGREDLHHSVFDTIHRGGNKLFVKSDEDHTFHLQLEFAKAHDITAEEFTRAYKSSSIRSSVERAAQLARLYGVEGVPSMIINGKYKTGMRYTPAREADLIALVSDLAASEHHH